VKGPEESKRDSKFRRLASEDTSSSESSERTLLLPFQKGGSESRKKPSSFVLREEASAALDHRTASASVSSQGNSLNKEASAPLRRSFDLKGARGAIRTEAGQGEKVVLAPLVGGVGRSYRLAGGTPMIKEERKKKGEFRTASKTPPCGDA